MGTVEAAKEPYREHVMALLGKADVPCSFDQAWCNSEESPQIFRKIHREAGRRGVKSQKHSPSPRLPVQSPAVVSPEFPTGNGKVDLFLRWEGHRAVIEGKSFRNAADVVVSRRQAARHAKSQALDSSTLAIFVPVSDEGVRVVTVAIGWT